MGTSKNLSLVVNIFCTKNGRKKKMKFFMLLVLVGVFSTGLANISCKANNGAAPTTCEDAKVNSCKWTANADSTTWTAAGCGKHMKTVPCQVKKGSGANAAAQKKPGVCYTTATPANTGDVAAICPKAGDLSKQCKEVLPVLGVSSTPKNGDGDGADGASVMQYPLIALLVVTLILTLT